MKHNLLKSLIILVILLTGVSNAWGDDTRQFLIGDATGGNWTENKFAYPVDSYYGQDNKCCIYVWMQNGQHFAFCNFAGSQYGPKINNSEPIYDGSAIHDNDNGRGAYEQYDQDGNVIKDNHGNDIPTTNAWKYTGNTGLVRICVDYSFEGNVWRPYVWVEELTNVLKGTEVMFYFGDTWGSSLKYIRSANTTNDKDIKFVGQAGFNQLDSQNTYSTCCKVPIGQYWISNTSTWEGEQMHQATEGGAMHSLTSNGYGNNHINVIPGVKPIWTPNESKIQVDKGTTNSGITATCDNSVIGKTNTIYYCYTQDNENYYRFDPTDISNLDCGTYTVWAIACDGHIVVRSAEPKILQVGYTVTLAGTDYGKYTVICGNREETITSETVTIDVPTGTQLTITDIQPKTEGYDQTMVYSLDDGANYTYFSDSTEIDGNRTYTYTVTSDVTIAEDFRTTDSRVVYIKVTYHPYWHWCTINKEKDVYPRIIYYNGVNQNRLHNEANLESFELLAETNQYNIYGVKIPKGYNSFKLYPGNSFSEYGGREEVFSYQIIPEDPLKNCFEFDNVENNTGPKPDGKWVSGSVNLKKVADYYDSDGYGHITVQYNNTKYTSKSNEDVTFKTPIGSTITIVESQHEHPETYNGDLKYTYGGSEQYLNDPVNHPISVWGDIEITENFVVRKEAVEKKNLQVYLKIPKNDLLDQWKGNDWEEKGDNVRPGYAGNKFANFIWLGTEVKRGQSITGSTEAERGCPKRDPSDPKTQPEGSFLMYPVNIADDNYEIYYCTITDYDWHTIKFERKHEDSDPNVAQLTCADVQRFPGGKNNCFTITGRKNDGAFIGEWGPVPQCQVEMGYTNIGRYGIKDYTGEIHYATPGGTNTTFNVPYGSRVEVLEGEPRSDVYNGMVGLLNGNTVVNLFHDGQNQDNFVTITGYTMFDDLFVSKQEHIVYLGVPNEGFDNWRLNDGERMTVRHLWPRDYIPSEYVNYEEMFVIDDITYYKFTLPAGIYKFQFSHRQNDSQISASRNFAYQIPVTEYNCFILENRQDGNGDYDGYWAKLPKPNVGDYRVLYAEKELIKTHEEGETEDWETAFRTVYEHPSDIIPKGEASKTISLHINTSQKRGDKTVHPMVILQQFQQMPESNTYKWVNLQAHTVLPLKATGNMGMLPGRKKAFGDLPFYDDGIEAIKNDTTYSSRLDSLYKGSGVWNFTVTQGVSQSSTTVTLNVGNTTRYTGKYYIRTEALTNGWDDYTDNLMTYSDYADYNSGFSHYFCKWLLVGNNVKFTIANDHAQSISDPLYGDATDLWGDPIDFQMVESDQVLNEDANVRFAWYEMNNFVHRAYLGGSTHVQDRFLVVEGQQGKIFSHYVGEGLPAQGTALPAGGDGSPRYGLKANEEIFRDDANWIYHADIQIKPGCIATVTARHYNHEQTFIKNRTLVYGEDLDKMTNKYPIRLLYDFKINRLITGYIPNGDNRTEIEAFTTDLMLIRREEPNDEDSKVTQLVFKTKAMDNSNTRAYGVLELSKERLVNDGNYNDLKRRLYWISFPFDVRIADVFGSGIYAQHWIIQSYNGQKRAANGYYYETTESNWEYHFDPNTINEGDSEYQGVLKKGVGYVVALNLYNIWKDQLLENTKDAICLYFPSKDLISADIVQNQDIIINVPKHECKKKGREIADSHWNVIGVPAYKNAGAEFNQPIDLSTDCPYYYRWDKAHNAYTPMAGSTREFSTLHAYMVQYHGGLNWKGVVREGTQSLAARSNTDHQIEHNLRLELQKDGKELDRTFVRLQENEDNVTSGFDFNYDLSKIINAGTNIYTIVKTNDLITNVSGNVLPLAEDMVIPVGVVIDQAGEYTFSMPDGTDGIIAELIDYQTNTRTNLLLDNYTVTLPAGTNNSRFALSLQPDKTVTSVDNIGNEATGDKVKKYLIDGKLYLQKDGVLYDAQGHSL